MAQAGPVSSRSDIQDQDVQAWQALFLSFLEQKGIPAENFSVAVSESELSIETSNALVLDTIKEALRSPDLTRQTLRYTLKEMIDFQNDGFTLTSPQIDFSRASALNVLSRIFSEDVLVECGLSRKLLTIHDKYEEKTLRIPVSKAAGFDNLWKARLEILTAAMIGAGIKGMSEAYLKDNQAVVINQSIKVSDLELAPAFQKVAGIEKNLTGDYFEFFINYQALLKLLFPAPPVVRIEHNVATSSWELKLNKDEAINYLIRAFQEGFILHRDGPHLRPILLPRGKLAKSKNVISLILDCSGSMTGVFSKYIADVKALVERILEKSAPGDIVRIVAFASEFHRAEFILTEDKNADKERIFSHFDTLRSGGLTFLYDTVINELRELENYANYVQSVVIFTDGEHYIRQDQQPEDPAIMKQQGEEFLAGYTKYMAAKASHLVPSVFTMGLGDSYNQEMLKMWAQKAGVSHTHLRTIEDFKGIFAQLEKMGRPRLLVKFMQNLVERFYSVYEGTLSMPPDLTIDPAQPFNLGDKVYRVEQTPNLSAVAAAAAAVDSVSVALVPPAPASTATVSRSYTPSFSGSEPDDNDSDEEINLIPTWLREKCRLQ